MIYVHTLAFNIPSEVEIATKQLYDMNKGCNFKHIIADPGFPQSKWEFDKTISIEESRIINSAKLKEIAEKYGSEYIKIKNIGVSQNWTQVGIHVKLNKDDVLLCADPDERCTTDNWVNALANIILNKKVAWCSLLMKEQIPLLESGKYPFKPLEVNGINYYIMEGLFNWAQGGFSGRFLNEVGQVPYPHNAPIYGWIESCSYHEIKRLGYDWAIAVDYFVEHHPCPPVYGLWKLYNAQHVGSQIQFDEYLTKEWYTR